MIPWIIVCTMIGTTLNSIEDANGTVSTGNKLADRIILVVGLLATVVATVVITSYARRYLKNIENGADGVTGDRPENISDDFSERDMGHVVADNDEAQYSIQAPLLNNVESGIV